MQNDFFSCVTFVCVSESTSAEATQCVELALNKIFQFLWEKKKFYFILKLGKLMFYHK